MEITLDSRKVKENSIFFCTSLDKNEAEKYINDAILKGAAKIYTRFDIKGKNVFVVDDFETKLRDELREFYPNKPKFQMAITGTNGKTSTAYFVWQILRKMGKNCVYIGTIGVFSGQKELDDEFFTRFNGNNLTTPDLISIHEILHIASTKMHCDYAIFEASSHGISQGRIDFLDICTAGFTNFTQDHLDYHKNMDEYWACKEKLFTKYLKNNGVIIANIDDGKTGTIVEKIAQENSEKTVITYGKNGDLQPLDVRLENGMQKITFAYKTQKYYINSWILGDFQVYNLLCASGFMLSLGFKISDFISILGEIMPPPGRLERVKKADKYYDIYIDYAHTPDALEKALVELRKITTGRLICIFGCGGDRDNAKRAIMGKTSVSIANFTIITDDNPRTEDAAKIRAEIISGIRELKAEKMARLKDFPIKRVMLFALQNENVVGNFMEIDGRKNAIEYGVLMMQEGDVLLIAGKGHENYQIIGTKKEYFSDFDEVASILS
ncbi:UDP-N-acetylmuramoyl-L-alanyl-D-glutamate--2,6-diaminopimelate ligase [Candidatus Deianiraea vastatrix]|uniref:UDP-N-acetylmuramoyl-L-alanyl-D-glutamate--2,6-diaminopimelate ligase n=2 Tax=Candidatus Deianiraea vastatrix TaxID=2163644 RepID=A0A5B8XF19_9RICK|nr:UDP-N-acetylmuramoyl-L-alanyl-D-glutamate--2,6-diaminopimelate ligase [Candidatus Deianiraea vastatrix]